MTETDPDYADDAKIIGMSTDTESEQELYQLQTDLDYEIRRRHLIGAYLTNAANRLGLPDKVEWTPAEVQEFLGKVRV